MFNARAKIAAWAEGLHIDTGAYHDPALARIAALGGAARFAG